MREDINRQEKIIDDVEDEIAGIEDDVRNSIDIAEQRFENKRDCSTERLRCESRHTQDFNRPKDR